MQTQLPEPTTTGNNPFGGGKHMKKKDCSGLALR